MRIVFTRRAAKDLAALPPRMADRLRKQLDLLQANLRHPSIDAKKYGGVDDIWQGGSTGSIVSISGSSTMHTISWR